MVVVSTYQNVLCKISCKKIWYFSLYSGLDRGLPLMVVSNLESVINVKKPVDINFLLHILKNVLALGSL